MRISTPAAIVLFLVFLVASPSIAGAAHRSRFVVHRTSTSGSAVTVGADGTVHVFYITPGYRLRHSWKTGKGWKDEAVDANAEVTYECAAAVDPQGSVHVAFRREGTVVGEQSVLIHAVRGESGWTFEELGTGGLSPSIAFGSDGLPRILHVLGSGNLSMLETFNGTSWDHSSIGVPAQWFMGTSLIIDGLGHAHATMGLNTQLYYATNASGTWVGTPLGVGGASASVVLDPSGRPNVVASFYSGVSVQSVTHLRYDGSTWTSEVVFDDSTGVAPDVLSCVSDGRGGFAAMVSGFVPVRGGGAEITLFLLYDGFRWTAGRIDIGDAGFDVALARGPDGAFFGTYRRRNGGAPQAVLTTVRLPDLSVSWVSTQATPEGEGRRVEGALQVQNLGSGRSRAGRISFYLSADDSLDESDVLLDDRVRVPSIAPGGEVSLPVSLSVALPAGPMRILAVLDDTKRSEDSNRLNNAAPFILAE